MASPLNSTHHTFDLFPALLFSHIKSFKRDNLSNYKERRVFDKEQIPVEFLLTHEVESPILRPEKREFLSPYKLISTKEVQR